MLLSLRSKLALLIALVLTISILPILVISHHYVGENALSLEKSSFADILNVAEENLNASFMNFVAVKVGEIIKNKNGLLRATRQMDALFPFPAGAHDPIRGELSAYREALVRQLAAEGIWVGHFRPSDMLGGPVTELGLSALLSDPKGRTLNELLRKLNDAGDFAVFHLPHLPGALSQGDEQGGRCLMYFLPHRGSGAKGDRSNHGWPDEVLVSAISLAPLEKEAEEAEERLIESVQERLQQLTVYEKGFIALLGGEGGALASHGAFPFLTDSARVQILAEARREGRIERSLPMRPEADAEQEYLVLLSHVRPFNWFLIIAAPMREIREPSRLLLRNLVLVGGMTALVALALSLTMLSHVVRPLRLLMKKTRELPAMDLTSPEAVAAISQGLPVDRQDEVGELAAAYAAMGKQLSENIRQLMEASSLKERMLGELQAAREIQQGILPPADLAPNIFGLSSSAFLDPAKEVGGDLYDFFITADGRYAFVLGDVSGKGVPAALFMAMTVTLVRFTLNSGIDPASAMTRISELLQGHNPGHMFVTLFLALYDARTGELEYANGAHCFPLVFSDRDREKPRCLEGLSGPLVGIIPDAKYSLFTFRLNPGDLCLLYTDGVTEAADAAGEFFSMERLVSLLEENRRVLPKELLKEINEAIIRYRGAAAPSDDITMLAFARRNAAPN